MEKKQTNKEKQVGWYVMERAAGFHSGGYKRVFHCMLALLLPSVLCRDCIHFYID